MFYEPASRDKNVLPHDPLKAIVAPRPIGWISTVSSDGVANLSPYSFFNAVSSMPDMVMFSSAGWKDSVTNAKATREFVCNYVSEDLAAAMNQSSVTAPSEIDEFSFAHLEKSDCRIVKAPRVADAPAALECRVTNIVELDRADGSKGAYVMVIGEIVGVHIRDEFITPDGRFDAAKARPVTRMGYRDYGAPGEIFEMIRPPDWTG